MLLVIMLSPHKCACVGAPYVPIRVWVGWMDGMENSGRAVFRWALTPELYARWPEELYKLRMERGGFLLDEFARKSFFVGDAMVIFGGAVYVRRVNGLANDVVRLTSHSNDAYITVLQRFTL